MKHDIAAICELMRECGSSIRDIDRAALQIDSKAGHANFVTDYDKKVQDRLKSGLLKIMPDAHFIGEEGTTQEFSPKGKFFIVDPIDGTTNFIKDFRASSKLICKNPPNTATLIVDRDTFSHLLFGTTVA